MWVSYSTHVIDAFNTWNAIGWLLLALMLYGVWRLWRGMRPDAFERGLRALREGSRTTVAFPPQRPTAAPRSGRLLQVSLLPLMLVSCGAAMLIAQAQRPDDVSRPATWALFLCVGTWYGAWPHWRGVGPLRNHALAGVVSGFGLSALLWGFYLAVDISWGQTSFTRVNARVPSLLWWTAVGGATGAALGALCANRIYSGARAQQALSESPSSSFELAVESAPRQRRVQWGLIAMACCASLLFHLSAAPHLDRKVDVRYWTWNWDWRPHHHHGLSMTLTMAPSSAVPATDRSFLVSYANVPLAADAQVIPDDVLYEGMFGSGLAQTNAPVNISGINVLTSELETTPAASDATVRPMNEPPIPLDPLPEGLVRHGAAMAPGTSGNSPSPQLVGGPLTGPGSRPVIAQLGDVDPLAPVSGPEPVRAPPQTDASAAALDNFSGDPFGETRQVAQPNAPPTRPPALNRSRPVIFRTLVTKRGEVISGLVRLTEVGVVTIDGPGGKQRTFRSSEIDSMIDQHVESVDVSMKDGRTLSGMILALGPQSLQLQLAGGKVASVDLREAVNLKWGSPSSPPSSGILLPTPPSPVPATTKDGRGGASISPASSEVVPFEAAPADEDDDESEIDVFEGVGASAAAEDLPVYIFSLGITDLP